MPEPSSAPPSNPNAPTMFSGPERRSLLLPVLLAVAALALAAGIATHFFPATTVNIAQVRCEVVPVHVVFGSSSQVVGVQQAEDTLFIAETVRIENGMRQPIYLDDFHLTLADANHAELTERGATVGDLPALEKNFPALVPVLTHPLARETTIQPGQSAEGTILFSLRVAPEVWAARSKATVQVSLYHLTPLFQNIPKP